MSGIAAEVAQLCEIYKECVYKKDYLALAEIYHESIQVFDLWNGGMFERKVDWSDNLKNWLTSLKDERVQVSFESIKIETSEAVGFAHGLVTYRAVDQNNIELRKMKNRFSWGLVKVDDNWLIAHQHTSVPIEFETTKAIFYPRA